MSVGRVLRIGKNPYSKDIAVISYLDATFARQRVDEESSGQVVAIGSQHFPHLCSSSNPDYLES